MLPEDFVALALAQDLGTDAARYGYSLRVAGPHPGPPGLIALTWIAARTPDERARIRDLSRRNAADFVAEPGFISMITGFIGLRGFTVTAWADEDALHRGLGGNHAAAMRALFAEDFVGAVWTSVWVPTRMNRLWVRCTACATLVDASPDPAACPHCGAALPARPAYW